MTFTPKFIHENKSLILASSCHSIPPVFSSRFGNCRGLCKINSNFSNKFLCGEQ